MTTEAEALRDISRAIQAALAAGLTAEQVDEYVTDALDAAVIHPPCD